MNTQACTQALMCDCTTNNYCICAACLPLHLHIAEPVRSDADTELAVCVQAVTLELEALQHSHNSSQTTCTALRAQLEAVQEEHSRSMSHTHAQSSQLHDRVAQLQQQLQDAADTCMQQADQIQQLHQASMAADAVKQEDALQKAHADLSELQTARDAKSSELAAVTHQLEALTQENTHLSERHEQASQAHAALSQRHQDLSQHHNELSQQHQELMQQYQELSQQHQELVQQHQELSQQWAALSGDSAGRLEQAAAAEQEVALLRSKVRELTRTLEEHAGSKEGLQEMLSQQVEEAERLKVRSRTWFGLKSASCRSDRESLPMFACTGCHACQHCSVAGDTLICICIMYVLRISCMCYVYHPSAQTRAVATPLAVCCCSASSNIQSVMLCQDADTTDAKMLVMITSALACARRGDSMHVQDSLKQRTVELAALREGARAEASLAASSLAAAQERATTAEAAAEDLRWATKAMCKSFSPAGHPQRGTGAYHWDIICSLSLQAPVIASTRLLSL